MKIAIVTDYFEPSLSGITEHVRGQARHLLALGHEVTVVTGNVAHRLATADAPVRPPATAYEVIRMGTAVPLYGNGGQTLHTVGYRLGRRLAALFRARQFDVVHVHAPHNPRMPAWAIDRVPSGSLAVGTFHTVFPITRSRRLQAQLLCPTIQRLDGRICVSAACIGSLRPLYPFSYDVIPNGVDTEVFTPSAEPARPARAGVRTIAFLGRFDPRNQLGLMLDAFRVICDETDDVRLIVIGDGPLRAHYVRRMSARARARTVFAGRLDHTRPQHLTSADIACFTSSTRL